VPAQGALNNLTITLPLPQFMQAWEVSPGDVQPVYKAERVPGGMRLTLKEFDLTAAIICTDAINVHSDDHQLAVLQLAVRNTRKLAAQWAHDLAAAELNKVRLVDQQLSDAGHQLPDGAALFEKAEEGLKQSERLWDEHNYTEAYHEAQRALRPL